MPFPDFSPTLPQFLAHIDERFAQNEVMVLEQKRLRFREADRRSARLATGLLAHGITKGTRVGLLMPNGPDWLLAFLAVTRLGATLVPLNTFLKAPELAWALRDADIHTLLTVDSYLGNDYLERLQQAAPELGSATTTRLWLPSLPHLRQIFCWGDTQRPWTGSGEALEAGSASSDEFLSHLESQVTPADTMLMLYTSGSTGDPKGVLHRHGTVIRHSYNLASSRDITSQDRVWTPMPFFWVGGLIFTLMGNLHAGATTICEKSFEPAETLRLFERERVSIALGWPHFGKALSEHPSRNERDLSHLRAGNVPSILGPDVVSPDPERRPNALGMTETCGPHTWVSGNVLPESLRGSFGRAVDGVEHKIIDLETGSVLPAGQLGEICVRGYSLMQGLNKLEPEETFDEAGFYHTGDVGLFSLEGVLYFKGRLGEMIKTAGANVTPSEVEKVLLALPEVKTAHVVGIPHPDRGQNVAAAVVPVSGTHPNTGSLKAALKPLLSAYKIPRHFLFYDSESALPFTDSGKIDKTALQSQLSTRIAEGEVA